MPSKRARACVGWGLTRASAGKRTHRAARCRTCRHDAEDGGHVVVGAVHPSEKPRVAVAPAVQPVEKGVISPGGLQWTAGVGGAPGEEKARTPVNSREVGWERMKRWQQATKDGPSWVAGRGCEPSFVPSFCAAAGGHASRHVTQIFARPSLPSAYKRNSHHVGDLVPEQQDEVGRVVPIRPIRVGPGVEHANDAHPRKVASHLDRNHLPVRILGVPSMDIDD